MVVPLLVLVVGIALCLAANVYGRSQRAKDPRRFAKFQRFIYPPICIYFTIHGAINGVRGEDSLFSLISLQCAAFFATSFVSSLMYSSRRETRLLKSHSPDENRFGMMQLMLFVTFFALGMGLRAFVWS